ncbi:Prostaglandin reductase 3 [Phlyctochytrium bullatum]|nr:Prostaglandin reductase 3 [Phlyctochytrium bullatum]
MSAAPKTISTLPDTFRKYVVHKLTQRFDEATRLETVKTADVIAAMRPTDILLRNHYVAINASDTNFTGEFLFSGTRAKSLWVFTSAYNAESAGFTCNQLDVTILASSRDPFDCGFESLGEVVAIGAKVTKIKLGDFVAAMSNNAFAEYQVIPAHIAIPVPSPRPEILALLVSGLTSALALDIHGKLGERKGETVLITAAAGGAGQIAVQLAKLSGAHVIGTCSSDSKVQFLKKLGCDRVINYKKEDIGAVLKKEYRKGIDIIFESVGGKTLTDCFNSLATKGRLIIIGAIASYQNDPSGSGPTNTIKAVMHDQVPTADLLFKSATVTGFFLNHYTERFGEYMSGLINLVQKGLLLPALDMPFDKGIASVPEAIAFLQTGKNTGKVVVPLLKPSKL